LANSSDTGCGTIIAVAAIAFFVGRASVSEKVATPEPLIALTQQFMDAPATDTFSTPTEQPAYATPKPEPEQDTSVYFPNCSAARAAGAAPVYEGDAGYARKLDRDGDGVGCE
jgi:hypothetical protein